MKEEKHQVQCVGKSTIFLTNMLYILYICVCVHIYTHICNIHKYIIHVIYNTYMYIIHVYNVYIIYIIASNNRINILYKHIEQLLKCLYASP